MTSRGSAAAARRLAEIDDVFTALAHPARRQILLVIHHWGGEMTSGDIARRFDHAWPTTTRHLRVLLDAGLLTEDRVSRNRVYRLARPRLDVVTDWVALIQIAGDQTDDRNESDEESTRTRGSAPALRARAS